MAEKEIHFYDPKTGAYLNSYPTYREAERTLNLYRNAVSDLLRRRRKGGKFLCSRIKTDVYPGFVPSMDHHDALPINEGSEFVKPMSGMLTEEQLRKKHDMLFMVLSSVKSLTKKEFIEETQMLRDLGLLGKPRYRDILTRSELKDYHGKADGVVYYGHPDSIRRLKQEGVLQ